MLGLIGSATTEHFRLIPWTIRGILLYRVGLAAIVARELGVAKNAAAEVVDAIAAGEVALEDGSQPMLQSQLHALCAALGGD